MQVKSRNYTVEEVAEIQRCSAETVRRHAKRWGGKKDPYCRRWLFSPAAVRRMLEEVG